MGESRRLRRANLLVAAVGVLAAGTLVATSQDASGATPPVSEIYVADYNGGAVSQLGVSSTGAVTALPYPTAPASARVSHMIVSPNGKYAYALDCNQGQIRQYTVDTGGLLIGALVPMTPAFTSFGACIDGLSEPNGHGFVENHAGTFVYVTSVAGGSGLTDILSFKVGTTGALTQAAFIEQPNTSVTAIAIAPSGKFAFVAQDDGLLAEYNLDTTGHLTNKATITVGGCPSDVAVSGTGKNVFITDSCSNRILNYSLSTTGVLSIGQIFPTGGAPSSVVVSPTSRSVYVTNRTGNSVSQYGLSTTGLLSVLLPSAWPVGAAPDGAAITKSGKFLYVTNSGSNTISAFNINATTHQLTPMSVPTIGAGAGPWGIAIRN